jgi:tetratricopeptide (TPR) repeat protein
MSLARLAAVFSTLLAAAAFAFGGPPPGDRLESAARSWDLEAAESVRVAARTAADTGDPAARFLHARACLLTAELLRVRWEETPPSAREARQQFGARIDVAAQEGLEELKDLPDSSERSRIEADLLATMIRSDFRARRLEARLRAAIDHALALDPDNPRALTSSAKPLLFADAKHGGDLRAAVERLDRALRLDPSLEAARLLRAVAYQRLGETARAEADWKEALRRNPACQPARRGMDELSRGASAGTGAASPPRPPNAATPPPPSG